MQQLRILAVGLCLQILPLVWTWNIAVYRRFKPTARVPGPSHRRVVNWPWVVIHILNGSGLGLEHLLLNWARNSCSQPQSREKCFKTRLTGKNQTDLNSTWKLLLELDERSWLQEINEHFLMLILWVRMYFYIPNEHQYILTYILWTFISCLGKSGTLDKLQSSTLSLRKRHFFDNRHSNKHIKIDVLHPYLVCLTICKQKLSSHINK